MWRCAFSLVAVLAAFPPPATGQDYEIGPGDVVHIAVQGQEDLTGDFRVDAEGSINYPIIGKIKAAAHTPLDLERKLTTLLADGYLRRPMVTVTVAQYGSQRVYVTGEVQKPGPYGLRADRSLLALLADVGGLGANVGHEVIVIRPFSDAVGGPVIPTAPAAGGASQGGTEGGMFVAGQPLDVPSADVFRISLQELQSGNPERNVLLQPGDTVYFPRAAQVYITGSVGRPGPYKYQEGMTILQALTLAGGVTERGSAGRTKVVRIEGGKKKETKAKPTDIVQPEDLIVVPERFF
jgi:polysaccharide export outer membrane protein